MRERTDILIVGGGLVGASLALALDAAGCAAMLLDAQPVQTPAPGGAAAVDGDDRNLVLARASVNALAVLGAWPALEAAAGSVTRVDVSRAGEFGRVRLSAAEMGVAALGRVVPGRLLAGALQVRLAQCRHIRRLAPATLVAMVPTGTGWRARVATDAGEHEIDARLVVGADGSDSSVRAQVGIAADVHDYRQSLIVCSIACGRDAPGCAFERFTDTGPVALLPLANGRRGLVLTVATDAHDAVAGLDDAGFAALAQRRFGWKLGAFSRPGRRFPHRIRRVLAATLTASRAVVVGNAAQTLHPIGAQGFNLGLRDALTLAELIALADDPGAAAVLEAYAARRRPDRDGVIAWSHGLISLVCLAQPALAPVRSFALGVVDRLPPLRRAIARHGMGFRGTPPDAVLEAGP